MTPHPMHIIVWEGRRDFWWALCQGSHRVAVSHDPFVTEQDARASADHYGDRLGVRVQEGVVQRCD